MIEKKESGDKLNKYIQMFGTKNIRRNFLIANKKKKKKKKKKKEEAPTRYETMCFKTTSISVFKEIIYKRRV